MRTIALALLAALALAACPRPIPNPGKVVIACTMDAVNDPDVVAAVLEALATADFRDTLAALIKPAGKVTAEVIACILRSFTAGEPPAGPAGDRMRASPGMVELQKDRARTYLAERGYEVP